MLGQNVKLFLMFQTVDLQNLVNLGQREGYRFKFQSLGEWKSLKI
jgi:hypothetical protein